MSRISPASQPMVEPATARFAAVGDAGAAPFGAVLGSFGQGADSQGLGRLPAPNERGATAFDALGMFEGGENPNGDSFEPSASSGPVSDDPEGVENAEPRSSALVAPMPLPSTVMGSAASETEADEPSRLAGITMGSTLSVDANSSGSQLAGRQVRPGLPMLLPTEHGLPGRVGFIADVADVEVDASPSTLASSARVTTREQSQEAAAVAVVLHQGDEGLPSANVSMRGSALGDGTSEGLGDRVRALLARHGLVLRSLRVNGQSASSTFANEDRG